MTATLASTRYTVGTFVPGRGWTVLVDGIAASRTYRTKGEAAAAARNVRTGLTDAERLSA